MNMMQNVHVPAVALVFSCFLIIVYFSKKRVNLLENKLYMIMLIAAAIDALLSTALFFNIYTNYSEAFAILMNRLDYIMLITWISSLFLYTFIITYQERSRFKANFKLLVIFVILFNIGITIWQFNLPVEIRIISEVQQTAQGPAVQLTHAIWGFYTFLTGLLICTNLNKINKKHIPIFLCVVGSLLLFWVFAINPYLIIISITITFINFVMYHTIENPDIKMLKEVSSAKDHAEKANMAKSDFLSSMSHEIRTPLNAIKGFSELTVETTDIREANENAKEVVRATETLLEIINGVLDISRIESGNMELNQIDYNPVELFNDTSRMINVRMKEKALDFRVNVAKDIPSTLYGDRVNIQKVLINLLTNAVKYTNEGHVLLDVQCINKGDKCTLVISIEDTGRGIKSEQIKTLFNKWERLEEDKNTTVEGTGLGLAITQQLVEMMNGKIVVQSVYGSGSKFMVTLNQEIKNIAPNTISVYHPEKKSMIKTPEESVKKPSTESPLVVMKRTYPNKKVLIVDDNNLNLKIVDRILNTYELEVVAFNSAHEVLEHINQGEKYDLLLVDDMMPKMTGTQMMKNLKATGYPVPMVVLTANVMSGERERYIKEGFDDYLAKPVNKEELDRVLYTYLHKEEEIETI